jgi:hypothetical protein
MLTIPPKRKAFEAARAAEIQAADQAVFRERLGWFLAAICCSLAGAGIASVGLHVTGDEPAAIWIGSGLLLGEIGPMVILWVAVKREEM